MESFLLDALWAITFAQALLLLAASGTRALHTKATRIFALMILLVLYEQAVINLTLSGQITNYPALVRSGFPAGVALSTLLYLYVKTLLGPTPSERISPFHAIPTTLGVVWYVMFTLVFDRPVMLHLPSGSDRSIEDIVRMALLTAAFGLYLALSLKHLAKFQAEVKGFCSAVEIFHFHWLRFLLFLFFPLWLSAFGLTIKPHDVTREALPVSLTLIVLGIGFYGLKHSRLFFDEQLFMKSAREAALPSPPSPPPRGTLLSEREMELSKQRLTKLLDQDKLFLKENLRLTDLSGLWD